MRLTVLQLLPELEVGGVEQGTLEIAEALVTAGHRALVVSAGGRLVPRLTAMGAEHITLAVGRKRLSSLGLIHTLRKLFLKEQVDVVHARSRLPAWLGWFAIRNLPADSRPRWVTTVHGPYSINRYSGIMASGERVIAISSFIRDYILGAYPEVDPTRIHLIPRGVDGTIWHPQFKASEAWLQAWAKEWPALSGKRLLTLPGRLTRWKGQEDFLKLIAMLRERGLPVHGLLAGGAHPRKEAFAAELRAEAEALGIEEAVSFLGQRSDLREVLAISSCAFSLTAAPEAFGRTTVEALSLGIPVIGYDHGGTGEILGNVFPEGLVPKGDIEAAANRCAAFLATPPEVPTDHHYTVARLQRETLAVYEAVCLDLGRPRWPQPRRH